MLNLTLYSQTPNDANHPFSQIIYSSTPSTNPYAIAWFQSVTLLNNHIPNNGYIIVDYIKLIEENISTGNETVLHIENYNGSGALNLNEGGLYKRFPSWYFSNTFINMSNSFCSGGFLTINVGQQPDSISHFWGVRKSCTIGNRHKIEIRLLISGDIALQTGMDYWEDAIDTSRDKCKEAFYSNWYGDSDNQFITIKFPDYVHQVMFDRTDYGFYENGKFYISKKLVDFVGGTSVALLCDATGWNPTLMTLIGDFYEYYSGNNYNTAQYYCFKVNPHGSSFFIPHAIINSLVYPNDAVSNGQGGYNFYTIPQSITKINTFDNDLGVSIFPNPTNGNIYFGDTKEIINISIYNIIGQLVLSKNNSNINTIDISKFHSGLYLIKMITSKGDIYKKIIKK